MNSFFNTTHMVGDELAREIANAKRQEDAVLAIFAAHAKPMTPSDVWRLTTAAGRDWPLTSIRRAMSSLTDSDALVMTDAKKPGIYSKPEHYWTRAA